jgi:hypothetical protein
MPSQNEGKAPEVQPRGDFTYDPEFERLAEQGFESDYVSIDARHIKPMLTLEEALQGFFSKGTKVRWKDNTGWPQDTERAAEVFDPEATYTVKRCRIGRSSSSYQFEEVPGRWNSVMFEKMP